jgi:hypothetical protein
MPRLAAPLAAIALCLSPHCRAQMDPDVDQAEFRARERAECTDADVPTLTQLARGRRAYRVEWAIEQLAARGPDAAAALPVLQELLQRPDPRVLGTASTVPIRAAAARAILAIAPNKPAAVTAKQVLSGLAPPVPAAPAVPERARRRAEQVVGELAQARTRAAAATNLVALGRLAVQPLLDALRSSPDVEFRNAALGVLRDLGPAAADAVPALGELLVALPAENTLAVVRALTATLPWSRDVVPANVMFSGRGEIHIAGHLIGTFRTDAHNELWQALVELNAAAAVEPDLPDVLASLLAHLDVLRREAALRIVAVRGPALRPLLPRLAEMLDVSYPGHQRMLWFDGGKVTARTESHDVLVHRLAAQAILAVAAPDDPLVAKARAVLAEPAQSDR